MRKIEISTAHNIVVHHELASVGKRILSAIIDVVILYFYVLLVGIVVGNSSTLFYILIFTVVWLYHLVMEIYFEGQSLGKKLLKIRVVSINGMSPTTHDYFVRWIFRTIDVTLSIGMLAIFWSSTSIRNQRLGDVMAGTTVINLKATRQFSLQKIMNISGNKSDISFPAVAKYSDSDMLLLKQSLIRHQKKPTSATKEILLSIRDHIVEDLNLDMDDIKAMGNRAFLKKVLEDFIVLTR